MRRAGIHARALLGAALVAAWFIGGGGPAAAQTVTPGPSQPGAPAPDDERIVIATRLALLAVPRLNADTIRVTARAGVVRLEGRAPAREALTAATIAVGKIPGVQAVVSEVSMDPSARRRVPDRGDALLEREAAAALRRETPLRNAPVSVRAEGGVLALRGKVAHLRDALMAAERVYRIDGVKAVDSRNIELAGRTQLPPETFTGALPPPPNPEVYPFLPTPEPETGRRDPVLDTIPLDPRFRSYDDPSRSGPKLAPPSGPPDLQRSQPAR